MADSEEEIYSIMFSSLKHPVRRKILRMLAYKPMTFMEVVQELGVSTSHLTYHLDSLGELIFKMESGQYKLSAFGLATVSAMRGIEEVSEIDPKHRLKLPLKWKAVFAVLMVAVLLLAGASVFQITSLNQLYTNQQLLTAENQQLLSFGMDTNKAASFLQDVAQINNKKYTITLLSNTLQYRTDFSVAEELIKYSLVSGISNLDVNLRFRNSHFSRYQLEMIDSSQVYTQKQPNGILQIAKASLEGYKVYSGDEYLDEMYSLLAKVNTTESTSITEGNMKLQIINSADTTQFEWMYTEKGIDYQAKGLRMTFQNNILTTMTDGYFLFTVGSTNMAISQDQAVVAAKNYVKTLTWNIDGKVVSGFSALDSPVSVQFLAHPKGNSVALIPYWSVVLRLDKVYLGGLNEVSLGIYADNGQVSDIQMLNG